MIDRQTVDLPNAPTKPRAARLRLVSVPGGEGRERRRLHPMSDFRRLQAFIVVAEELHFRRAAERLNIAQSPLSRTIRTLEEDLGFLLFDRNRRGVQLRPSGRAFLAEVRKLLDGFGSEVDRIRRSAIN